MANRHSTSRRPKDVSPKHPSDEESVGVTVFPVDPPPNMSAEELNKFYENVFADHLGLERPHPDFPFPMKPTKHTDK